MPEEDIEQLIACVLVHLVCVVPCQTMCLLSPDGDARNKLTCVCSAYAPSTPTCRHVDPTGTGFVAFEQFKEVFR